MCGLSARHLLSFYGVTNGMLLSDWCSNTSPPPLFHRVLVVTVQRDTMQECSGATTPPQTTRAPQTHMKNPANVILMNVMLTRVILTDVMLTYANRC